MERAPEPFRLRLTNARIATCAGHGTELQRLAVVEGCILFEGGRVAFLGPRGECPSVKVHRELDLGGRLVTPGLIDCHTHLVFAGSRSGDFLQKMSGVDYRTIAANGGGILSTVRATRVATDDELRDAVQSRLAILASYGVTTVEVKSGYGLTLEHELRSLRIARDASGSMRESTARNASPKLDGERLPRVLPTLLGAHAVPPEWTHDRSGYVREVLRMIDEASLERPHQGRLAHACDVYLDVNAFDVEEAGTILRHARAKGLAVRAHVGQFADLGGAEMAAELGATSCDHLEQVSDAGLAAMARSGTTAVLLPVAWRTLRQRPPDAERMHRAGVRIAVATDANPGTSPCLDPLVAVGLAVRDAGLSPAAGLLSLTIDAAHVCGAGRTGLGTLAVGGPAEFAVWDHDDPLVFGYALGGLRPAFTSLWGSERFAPHPPAFR